MDIKISKVTVKADEIFSKDKILYHCTIMYDNDTERTGSLPGRIHDWINNNIESNACLIRGMDYLFEDYAYAVAIKIRWSGINENS